MKQLVLFSIACGALAAQAAEADLVMPAAEVTRIREVLRHIYSLEYEQASAECEAMIREKPGDPAGYVYQARTYWSEYLNRDQALSIYRFAADDFFTNYNKYKIRIDAEAEERFRKVTREAIERARTQLRKRPDDLRLKYLLGVAYQNLASFEATVTHGWWSSFMNGDKNIKQHREVQKRAPGFADAGLANAVYDYVAASVSWKIRWLSALLGRPGSKARAKEELERVAAEALMVGDDARTVLAVLYTRDREYDRALAKLLELHERHPGNYLIHLEAADMRVRLKEFDRAVAEYSMILGMVRAKRRGYGRMEPAIVRVRLGRAWRANERFDEAEAEFRVVLADSAASLHSALTARLELAKTLDRKGSRDKAVELYREVVRDDRFGIYRNDAEAWIGKPYRGL